MVQTTEGRPHTDEPKVIGTQVDTLEVQTQPSRLPGVSAATYDSLWSWLVRGLLVILGIAVVGLIVAAERDAPRTDDLIAPVTAILSGVLALFVHPPTHSHHGDG